MRQRGRLILVAGIAVFLVSCVFLRDLVGLGPARPRATLVGFQLDRVAWDGLDLTARIRIDNPNRFAVGLAQLTYTVDVLGSSFATGKWAGDFSVPARGSGELHLPVTIDPARAFGLLGELMKSGETDVIATLKANGEFVSPIGNFSLDITEQKALPRPLARP